MIHKIDSLVSIGKFRNYQATGNVAFNKLTLFYADNGSGKTTISSVFRSLSENNPDRITKRKSTNSTVSQSAKIIQRQSGSSDVHHQFGASGWRYEYPNIEIFDIHFVDENIYSGCEFSDDHKKKLHQFVIGAQSVSIQQQIDNNKSAKTASKAIITQLEGQIVNQVLNGLSSTMITQFVGLKARQAVNIDQRISDAQAALSTANSNSIIQTLQSLSTQTGISLPLNLEDVKTDLETTSQTLQDASMKAVFNQHCIDLLGHGIEKPESWLKLGFGYSQLKKTEDQPVNCPFCRQPVTESLQIIKAYTNLFNEEFNSLANRLNDYIATLTQYNLEVILQRINSLSSANSNLVSSWGTHLPGNTPIPSTTIVSDANELRSALTALIEVIKSKAQNPSNAVSLSALTNFQTLLATTAQNIIAYNGEVATYNNGINLLRSGIQTVIQAQNSLNDLQRVKKRFDPVINTLCSQLQAEKQTLRGLETAYTALSSQQQHAAQIFFTTYKDRINYYLHTVFKTSFKIDSVVHVAPHGRSVHNKINYRLTMEGHEISFNPTEPNSVKDCLSEGDKSTIALAFFLSKLDIAPDKADKILVFDDPLSSFDSNRRMFTVQLIKNLLADIKQIIVLSHNEHFLYEIYKRVAAAERKTLRISQNFLTNTSTIEELDLEKLVENDYFKHVKELEAFLQNPDLNKKDIVLGWLRNVLEAHIRFKFFRQLVGLTPNNQTFGKIITKLANSEVVFRCTNTTQIIDKLNIINAISCQPHHGEPIPDFNIIGTDPTTMNITELAHFVNDTLDLIDNKL